MEFKANRNGAVNLIGKVSVCYTESSRAIGVLVRAQPVPPKVSVDRRKTDDTQ